MKSNEHHEGDAVTAELNQRQRLFRALVMFCKRHGYTRLDLRLEDEMIIIKHSWSPTIERHNKKTREKAKKR